MTMTDDWGRVAAAADARLREMGVPRNYTAMAHASGVSDATWRSLLRDHRPVKRDDKRYEICDYLGWTHDSIQRVLGGGQPQLRPPPPAATTELERRVLELEHRASTADVAIHALRGQVEDVLRQIGGARRQAGGGLGRRTP